MVEALDFIEQIHTRPLHKVPVGDRVAVIGGGNTAIDAVTQARRLGARDAAIVYRRSQEEMPAYDFEQKLARTDGVRFLFNVVPVEILSNGTGHVTGLKLARTASANGKLQILAGLRNSLNPSTWSSRRLAKKSRWTCSRGFSPRSNSISAAWWCRNPDTGQTNLPRVFAGGDCANGGREVVNAVAEGKKAARGIHALLGGRRPPGPIQPSRYGVKGAPVGSGFDRPIRVPELEEEYAQATGGQIQLHGLTSLALMPIDKVTRWHGLAQSVYQLISPASSRPIRSGSPPARRPIALTRPTAPSRPAGAALSGKPSATPSSIPPRAIPR